MDQNIIREYARTVVTVGSNIRPGDELVVAADVEAAEFARLVTEEAYKLGAKKVTLFWRDEAITKLHYRHVDKDVLCEVEDWVKESRRYIVEHNAAYLQIGCADPDAFADVDASLLAAVSRAQHRELEFFYDATITNKIRWTICCVPGAKWASKVTGLEGEDATEAMWGYILRAARVYLQDGVAAWKTHCERIAERAEYLNREQFAALHFTSGLGTDLTLRMPTNYVFMGGREQTTSGIPFAANMPTEEIFSAPHMLGANGKVVASLPLVHNGKIVRDFGFTFRDGVVVDYYAAEGQDVLKGILDTDEGSKRLGEVALVPYDSPIQQMGVLFYNTLYDENASCHLALGKAYASSVVGGDAMNAEERNAAGINTSFEHVDFMFGTRDLCVKGIRADGSEVDVIKDGSFVI